ncbi:MAG: hypothetical protein LBE12_17130, partial [Planctomycetaceae bacterium]|nr:hypothetical protein [Planctomycetaceae bacterium]
YKYMNLIRVLTMKINLIRADFICQNTIRELLKTSGTQSSRLHIAYKQGRRDACVPPNISF